MMEAGLLNASPLCSREHEEQRMNLQEDIQSSMFYVTFLIDFLKFEKLL